MEGYVEDVISWYWTSHSLCILTSCGFLLWSHVCFKMKLLFFFFFFWFFFSELGTEPRALRFLGKRSTTELNPQPPCFVF